MALAYRIGCTDENKINAYNLQSKQTSVILLVLYTKTIILFDHLETYKQGYGTRTNLSTAHNANTSLYLCFFLILSVFPT